MEHEPDPDTWFPRERRGACIAGGPGTGSSLADRIIDQKIDERRGIVRFKTKEDRQKKMDEIGQIFQAHYEALAQFIPHAEAAERTHALYRRTCLGEPTMKVRGPHIVVERRFRMPTEHEIAQVRLFAEAAAGTAPAHSICPHCHCILKKANAASHQQRCLKPPKPHNLATSTPTDPTTESTPRVTEKAR